MRPTLNHARRDVTRALDATFPWMVGPVLVLTFHAFFGGHELSPAGAVLAPAFRTNQAPEPCRQGTDQATVKPVGLLGCTIGTGTENGVSVAPHELVADVPSNVLVCCPFNQ